jgi:hypothetical protein
VCHDVVLQDTYGPPLGKKLLMFIDDLNMPHVDTYGTQQPIALLKLFGERKGLYDRGKELSWKHVKDVQMVAAMGPPGGARNKVDPRFVSLFSAFEIQAPSNSNLRTIYQVRVFRVLVLATCSWPNCGSHTDLVVVVRSQSRYITHAQPMFARLLLLSRHQPWLLSQRPCVLHIHCTAGNPGQASGTAQ